MCYSKSYTQLVCLYLHVYVCVFVCEQPDRAGYHENRPSDTILQPTVLTGYHKFRSTHDTIKYSNPSSSYKSPLPFTHGKDKHSPTITISPCLSHSIAKTHTITGEKFYTTLTTSYTVSLG